MVFHQRLAIYCLVAFAVLMYAAFVHAEETTIVGKELLQPQKVEDNDYKKLIEAGIIHTNDPAEIQDPNFVGERKGHIASKPGNIDKVGVKATIEKVKLKKSKITTIKN